MLLWMGLVVGLAVVLIVGIERLLRRFGIQPERPEEASGGLRELLIQIQAWQADHAGRRK